MKDVWLCYAMQSGVAMVRVDGDVGSKMGCGRRLYK